MTLFDYSYQRVEETKPFVSRIFGSAGCGKTTYLMKMIDEELDRGLSIRQMVFIGYTRASCTEAIERLMKKEIFNNLLTVNVSGLWFHTIHALSLRLLSMKGLMKEKRIATFTDKKRFCESEGLSLSESEDDIISGESASSGSAFFSTKTYLINTFRAPEEWKDCEFATDIGKDFLDLNRKWTNHKEESGLIDFDDLLVQMNSHKFNVSAKVLFADEFQDLSPLQVSIVKNLMIGKERVYIAGDDFQAIFRFQGAEPELMLDFPSDETKILDQSYRCPRSFFGLANRFISQNIHSQPKDIKPRDSEGTLTALNFPSQEEIIDKINTNGTTYILLRTNWLVYKFSWVLASKGIPFKYLDKKKDGVMGWTDKKLKLVNDTLNLDWYDRSSALSKKYFDGEISKGVYSFLRYYLRRNKPINPELIRLFIGTIHSSKGREADTVILLDDITARVKDALESSGTAVEDERRIFYVGMTRARENLVIVHSFFPSQGLDIPSYNLSEQLYG